MLDQTLANVLAASRKAKLDIQPLVFWSEREVDAIENFDGVLPFLGSEAPERWEHIEGRVHWSLFFSEFETEDLRNFIKETKKVYGERIGFGIVSRKAKMLKFGAYRETSPAVPVIVDPDRFDDFSREQLLQKISDLEDEVEAAQVLYDSRKDELIWQEL